MRRTQLHLDDDLWTALHSRARSQKTTISELVRASVREHYFGKSDQRAKAMHEFVGVRKDSPEAPEAADVRTLRRGHRLDRLLKK
jgi:Arc/MetJ family transcription regulator